MLKGGKNQRGLDRIFRPEEGRIRTQAAGHNGVTGTRLATLLPQTARKPDTNQCNSAFQMLDNRQHRTVTPERRTQTSYPVLH